MSDRMVIAHHLVWTGYGWWLPNDPRGSTSSRIRQDILKDLGDLHFGRKRVQPAGGEIRAFYDAARDRLEHPLFTFDGQTIAGIGEAFANTVSGRKYTVYACAVMPDHVHLVVRKHRDRAEEMIGYLQRESAAYLRDLDLVPVEHPIWCTGGWKVFLHSPEDVRRTIPYVEKNPDGARLPRQAWSL